LFSIMRGLSEMRGSTVGRARARAKKTASPSQWAPDGPVAVGVSQRRLPVFAHPLFQSLDMAHALAEECGGAGTRHVSRDAGVNHAHSL